MREGWKEGASTSALPARQGKAGGYRGGGTKAAGLAAAHPAAGVTRGLPSPGWAPALCCRRFRAGGRLTPRMGRGGAGRSRGWVLGGVKPPPHRRGFVRGVQVAPPGSPPAPRCREAPPPAGGSAASPQAARGLEGGVVGVPAGFGEQRVRTRPACPP